MQQDQHFSLLFTISMIEHYHLDKHRQLFSLLHKQRYQQHRYLISPSLSVASLSIANDTACLHGPAATLTTLHSHTPELTATTDSIKAV